MFLADDMAKALKYGLVVSDHAEELANGEHVADIDAFLEHIVQQCIATKKIVQRIVLAASTVVRKIACREGRGAGVGALSQFARCPRAMTPGSGPSRAKAWAVQPRDSALASHASMPHRVLTSCQPHFCTPSFSRSALCQMDAG